MRVRPSMLDRLLHVIWEITDQKFPNRFHCRCVESCKRHYNVTHLIKGNNLHVEPSKLAKLKNDVREKSHCSIFRYNIGY